MISAALQKIVAGEVLDVEEAAQAMSTVMTGEATPVQIAALVTALRIRGERETEIAGFVQALRRHMIPVELVTGRPAVDVVGTGGDGNRTFNISTAAAFVVAGAGVPVAKHGNRAMSSRAGAADTLEALGVRIDLGPEAVARCVKEVGIGFMFAQRYHPALRHAAPVRRELGFRTVFNVLGPLANPACVRHQLVGVAMPELLETVARVLALLESEHAFVVHAADGLDELSLAAPTIVYEVRRNGAVEVRRMTVEPEAFGLKRVPTEALRGGSAEENARIVRSVLEGAPGPAREVTLLNAAAALVAADAAESFAEGLELARRSLESGAALDCLERLIALSQALVSAEVSS